MITQYPIAVEIVDGDQIMATVKTFDECCAEVAIKSVVDVELWDELSSEIRQALVALKLVEE